MRGPAHHAGALLARWQELLCPSSAALLTAARGVAPQDVTAVAKLRKLAGPELVGLALDLWTARRKLAAKWPDRAERLIADPHGAEMASSQIAATHKARRFAEVLGRGSEVLDLCCGIGGDAIGLADAGLRVLGVDADPARAWMCGQNAGCDTRACDVLDGSLPRVAFHLDPARRESATGRRTFKLESHQPPPEVWAPLLERHGTGAIKLGPGVDASELAELIPAKASRELEFISENGRLTQAVLWLGSLSRANSLVSATLLAHGHTHTLCGAPSAPAAGPIGRYLIEADPSVERAGLLGALADQHRLHQLHPGLGLLTGDTPADSAFCTGFEILEHMPWIEKHIRTWLHHHDAGVVEVKTRGGAVEPDSLQVRLRGEGGTIFTVFVLRLGQSRTAFITKRLRPSGK